MRTSQAVFIDPSYPDFLDDALFDPNNASLNRDNQLLPFIHLKKTLEARGVLVHTADKLKNGEVCADTNHYWSLGMIDYGDICQRRDVRMRGFIILEPPLVAPKIYKALPQITNTFEHVYMHNTIGDGYSLYGVDRKKLKKLLIPQIYGDIKKPEWHRRDRQNKLVIIAGLHNPGRRKPELYSKRIEAVGRLSRLGAIDLFGNGWDRWFSKQAATATYWRNINQIRSSNKGPTKSKLDTLSKYRFSLCFENTTMLGYVTEKIFDCFYAGTVPIYLGAKDISEIVPSNSFVDMRNFKSNDYEAMWSYVSAMSESEWQSRREAGRSFIRSAKGQKYFTSMTDIVSKGL